MQSILQNAYIFLADHLFPTETDAISSQFAFKIDGDFGGQLELKRRLVLYGNKDWNCYNVRSSRAAVNLSNMRLATQFSTFFGFSLDSADVKGAYMQSGSTHSERFVRPPTRLQRKAINTLKSDRLPYGIVRADHQ